ncbi:hypothetical protein [Sorangium sp. So ce590]
MPVPEVESIELDAEQDGEPVVVLLPEEIIRSESAPGSFRDG